MASQVTVPHLQWDTIPLETVNPSMQRRIVTGELMTIARIWFKDGFHVPMHSHANEQITQVISGILRFRFGDGNSAAVDVHPGEVVVIPAHLPHEATCIGDVEEMDMWAPRRDDWLDKSDDYLRQAG